MNAIDQTFYGFTGVITHLGCWENTRSRVFPTFHVGYHGRKPIESLIYCLNKLHKYLIKKLIVLV